VLHAGVQVNSAATDSATVYTDFFRAVWEGPKYKLGGKQTLMKSLNARNVYKVGNPKLAKSILIVVEHQLAVGPATAGSGGHSRHWDGIFSIEHIMPQVLVASPSSVASCAICHANL